MLWSDSLCAWQVKTFMPGAFATAVFTPEMGGAIEEKHITAGKSQ